MPIPNFEPAEAPSPAPDGVSSPLANSWLGPRATRIVAILLVFLGVQSWLILGHGDYGHRHELRWIAVALLAAIIRPVRMKFNQLWEYLAHPSRAKQHLIAMTISVLSTIFIYASARFQNISIHPYFHDEFSYLLQMRMLAHGRLWMPAHPLADYFDTFYIITRPVYASMYFPGAALMYVPTVWLHLPWFFGSLAAAGLCVGILYLIIAEMLDGALALLAVLLLLSEGVFRLDAIMLLSQIPVLFLGLAMIYACLQWRSSHRRGWLAMLGAAAGWASITRPADALCFAIPIAVILLLDATGNSFRRNAIHLMILFAAAAPFLALQVVFDRAVTGRFLQTPFELYTDQNYPGARYGFRQIPNQAQPQSSLVQKHLYFQKRILPDLQKHRWGNVATLFKDRLAFALFWLIPDPLLWLLFPLSVAALWDRRRWTVWAVFPLYLIVYTGYAFFPPPTYLAVLAPAMVLLMVLPISFLSNVFPRHQPAIRTFLGISIVVFAMAAMPQMDRLVHDQYFQMHEGEAIDRELAQSVLAPAVVLYHFGAGDNPDEEPVYNSDVIWPDDAAVIRAHDLNADVNDLKKTGDRNLPLYQYYARQIPVRRIYLYDRNSGNGQLVFLGMSDELVARCADHSAAR